MNRLLLPTTLLLAVSLSISAQNPVRKPGTVPKPKAPSILPDTVIENRLVQLVLDGPEYDASNHQNKINELELRKARAMWMNLLSLSLQLNDQSFKQPVTQVGQVAYVYPKYFFGVTIPLGVIFSQGATIKTAKESIAYAKDQQLILAAQLKANVLSKYKQYRLYDDLIEMQSELYNDVLAISTQAEESFKNGSSTVDAYIASQRSKSEELVKLKNLQLQQELVRIEIERMIGYSLESVLEPGKAIMTNPRPSR